MEILRKLNVRSYPTYIYIEGVFSNYENEDQGKYTVYEGPRIEEAFSEFLSET